MGRIGGRLRLEKLQILLGRSESEAVKRTDLQISDLLKTLPLDNIHVAPHADEILKFIDNGVGPENLNQQGVKHLTTTIAPLLRFAFAGSYPELFVTEERLREAYHQPEASLADFLRHILKIADLSSREASISRAFDEWVRAHPRLSATQLMFVRTIRKAVMQRAQLASVDSLREPPFSSIGTPEALFPPKELDELLELIKSTAA